VRQKSPSDSQKTPNSLLARLTRVQAGGAGSAADFLEEQLSSEVGEMTFQAIKTSVMKFVKDEDGLTVVEYAVAGGLISLVVVTAFTNLGTAVAGVIQDLIDAIT
jgi:pilus assembly protein Flp/PilA